MNTRRAFLERLFAQLDARGVSYVVLRNYAAIFEPSDSDVDLLAENVAQVFVAARLAAAESGHRLVQRTRFMNHSWVWWDGGKDFLRLDVDTALRWRCFEGPSAAGILARRVRSGAFWIPAPVDEAAGIRVQIACKGKVSERYAARLAELGAQPADAARERRALVLRNLANPLRWPRVTAHLVSDVARWRWRRRNPAGAHVRVAVNGEFDAGPLRDALAGIFPPRKAPAHEVAHAAGRAVFKGGLALEVKRATSDSEARELALAPSHFTALLTGDGTLHMAHAASGLMKLLRTDAAPLALAEFILQSLAHEAGREKSGRGLVAVLAGVDGAGKTTFARTLCELMADSVRFSGCRYFHFIPPLSGGAEFPWPAFGDLPRKSGRSSTFISALRLLRNLVRARLAWRFHVAPLVRAGRLVLLDRYVVNYWLDPESLRYSGPRWLLAFARRLFPKPDALIALDADAEILRARKGELTPGQIREQQQRLRDLPPLARKRLDFDASRPPRELAREALEKLETLHR